MFMIRHAQRHDLAECNKIYNAYLHSSNSHYATKEVTLEERRGWFENLKKRNYPILVAADQHKVFGFGALTPFHPLEGYKYTATGSLYIDPDHLREGVGKAIGAKLLDEAEELGLHTIIAGICATNLASINMHKAFGFKEVGYFESIGFKNEKWHDDVCLQLILKERKL